jgi:hypothetical protein
MAVIGLSASQILVRTHISHGLLLNCLLSQFDLTINGLWITLLVVARTKLYQLFSLIRKVNPILDQAFC